MGQSINNQVMDCNMRDFIGGNQTNYITAYQEPERDFVVTHNANIKPVSYFTGREIELQELRRRIEEGRKSVLVSGMGGIGKTQICRRLFDEYHISNGGGENRYFSYIGYIEYYGDMSSSLQECLKFKRQENPKLDKEAAWTELEHLASEGKLLLFVDNVNKRMSQDPGLEKLNGIPGAVVITSRQASLSDEFEPYRIGFLSTDQCREVYEKIRFENSGTKVKPEERQDLEYIIENLAGKHTITVQFLAHLARTKLWTVKRLREELETKGFRLGFHKNGELVDIQKSYEALYDLSQLSEAEQNILEAFSVFPYIPLKADVCSQWLLSDAGVCEEDDILMGLYEKGWLQFEMEQESYALHPVFAQFIYEKYQPSIKGHSGLIHACEESLKVPESGSPFECRKYLPFAEDIEKKMSMKEDINQIMFVDTIAYLFQYISEYTRAKKLYERSLCIQEKILGEMHPDTAASYNNIAYIYYRQGEYGKAEELYEKSLYIQKKVLGDEHPDTAASYNNLALVYEEQGEYEKAEKTYERSLYIKRKILGDEHPDTALGYHNLAMVYERQGEYGKAEELYKRSLRIEEKALGKEHPETALGYNNLGVVYAKQGEYGKAEELFKRSLRIEEKILGEEHLYTTLGYNNLAYVHERQGEYQKAEELYEKSLHIREKLLGKEHPNTASEYNNLARIYDSQHDYNIALKFYLKSYKILCFRLGKNHPKTQNVYKNMESAFCRCDAKMNFKQWLEENMKKE